MYNKSITRASKALFVIAIDQSASMSGLVNLGARTISKSEMVAEVANDLIGELVERARRFDGLRDYYDVAVLGYSGRGVQQLLDADHSWMPITAIDAMRVKELQVEHSHVLESGEVRIFSHFSRQWITPVATGDTPMYEAMLSIYDIVDEWCDRIECIESFPPIIFNITDGESTDCDYQDIMQAASKIKSLSTRDGSALLFNIHIASDPSCRSMVFPSVAEISTWEDCPKAANELYNSASDMPMAFGELLRDIKGCDTLDTLKAMAYNASITDLVSILNIGSTSIKCE